MTQPQRTKSELLFEEFCGEYGLVFNRFPEATERRPDYQIRGAAGAEIIVEVKQFELSDDELAAKRALNERRYVATGGKPGERVRQAIGDAYGQIKNLCGRTKPGLIVLYDDTGSLSYHSEPYAVLTAMRGLDVIDVAVPRDLRQAPIFQGRRPGPRKKLTERDNRSVSAVGVLNDGWTQSRLAVYHNQYATVPLSISDLVGPGVHHFRMSQDQHAWDKCVSLDGR